MKLSQIVKRGVMADFMFYRDGKLWYRTETGYAFAVPVSDTGTATFLPRDKAVFFMRWIRKSLEEK